MRDNTERMRMEKSLKKAKEEAEKAASAKEEFLAHMSHEIRTPLNAIVGLSNLLLQRNPREDQADNLQTLKFSSENLMALINDILDFSKLEAGKFSFEETEFSVKTLVNTLIQGYQFLAQQKSLALRLEVDENIPALLKGDQLKISQILHNLVSNAVKFTSQGGVTISIQLNKQETETVWLDFSVRDTGIGIQKEKLLTVFEKFTQADSSTVRQYGGTGLGLTITKMLLELMDSQIEVESEPGKGTRFSFTLKLKAVVGAGATDSRVVPAKAFELKDVAILLVEDVEINRLVIFQFLKDWWELTPDVAANGLEALEKVKNNHYDIILMDVRMPVMDGYEATSKIRNLGEEKYKYLPIIALTADTRQDFRKIPEANYFTDIVIKPFDPIDLQQKIVQHAPKEKIEPSRGNRRGKGHQKLESILKGDKTDMITFYEKPAPTCSTINKSLKKPC